MGVVLACAGLCLIICFLLQFTCVGGKDLKVSYPCVVLNVMVAEHNTNDQYQTLVWVSQASPCSSASPRRVA